MTVEEQARTIARNVLRVINEKGVLMFLQQMTSDDLISDGKVITIEKLSEARHLKKLMGNVEKSKIELCTFWKEQFPEEYKLFFGNLIPKAAGESMNSEIILSAIREAVEQAFVESGIRKLKDYEKERDWYGHTTLGEYVALVALAAVGECFELGHAVGHAGQEVILQYYEDYITRAIEAHLKNMSTNFGSPPWFE